MNKNSKLNNLIQHCNSDRVTPAERVDSAWRYCKCFSSASEGLEALGRELSRERVELLAQAASEVLAGFHHEEFGFYSGGSQASFDSENLVTREFISALSKIAGPDYGIKSGFS